MHQKIQKSVSKSNIAIPMNTGTFKDRMSKFDTPSPGRMSAVAGSIKISSNDISSPSNPNDPNGVLASIGVNIGSEIKGKKGSNLQ